MKKILIVFVVAIIFVMSCSRSKVNVDVDVSNVKVDLKVYRLEQDLFKMDTNKLAEQVPALKQKYGRFLNLYSQKVIMIGSPSDAHYPVYLKSFLVDSTMNVVYKRVSEVFPDMKNFENEMTEAFRHYKYYFPDRPVPQIYTMISGFNQSLVTDDKMIGIALDKYLGKDCDFYEKLTIEKYRRYKMHPQKMVSDCMEAWAMAEFPSNDSIGDLLGNMLYQAKVQYFVDAILPQQPDSLKFGFTTMQLKWCEKFEADIWKYLVEQKLLFTTENMKIKKFVDDGPFTTDFLSPTNAKAIKPPARAAVWLGREIIRSYMDHNPKLSLKDLMLENDYHKILNLAKYKP